MFQRHAFAFWKTMPLNIFNLTCNSFFKKKKKSHFLQRLPLYLLKVTKHLFLHYIFCSHVLSFWDLFLPCLCLLSPSCRQHPAPQGTVLTELQERTPLQSSLWRTSYKSLRYCCVWGRWGCGYLSKDCQHWIPCTLLLCLFKGVCIPSVPQLPPPLLFFMWRIKIVQDRTKEEATFGT